MKAFKCRTCGGNLEIGSAGSLECPYCGSRSFFSDSDFKDSEEFRKKLLSYYEAKATEQETDYSNDTLWESTGRDSYTLASGKNLIIDYMVRYDYSDCICYVAKEKVIYIFSDSAKAEKFLNGISDIKYPEADTKLSRCFPELRMNLDLEKGKALVFVRKPNFYPAEVLAPYESVHLAWVISRMENLCCALEYSEMEHNGIDATSVFINPKTHEGMLFGNWCRAGKKYDDGDLVSVRNTAKSIALKKSSPAELGSFLDSVPCKTAYDDFALWDTVIEKGFGGHKFIKM